MLERCERQISNRYRVTFSFEAPTWLDRILRWALGATRKRQLLAMV